MQLKEKIFDMLGQGHKQANLDIPRIIELNEVKLVTRKIKFFDCKKWSRKSDVQVSNKRVFFFYFFLLIIATWWWKVPTCGAKLAVMAVTLLTCKSGFQSTSGVPRVVATFASIRDKKEGIMW